LILPKHSDKKTVTRKEKQLRLIKITEARPMAFHKPSGQKMAVRAEIIVFSRIKIKIIMRILLCGF
jgi:hypothetical protein